MKENRNAATFVLSVQETLAPYRLRFEEMLRRAISDLGPENQLKSACAYALETPGKRFRPALVYMIADALGNHLPVDGAALAVEYFHTASLIGDDLPCMDNDDMRRGRPTTHKAYGESTALLASYALIAAGFEAIVCNGDALRSVSTPFAKECDRLSALAVLHASREMGISGLIGGQFLDLFPTGFSREGVEEVIRKKTVSLFDLSFVLGWLFGGGEIARVAEVQRTACFFGKAFQILDDLDDAEKDAQNGRQVNFANCFGVEGAVGVIRECVQSFHAGLQSLGLCSLGLCSSPLAALADGLQELALHIGDAKRKTPCLS